MSNHRKSSTLAQLAFAGALTALSSQALASAFMLHEAAASLLGEFYAGSAAISEDASTNWYNSAGLTQIKDYGLSVSGVNVGTYGDFEGTVQYTAGGTLSQTGEAKNGAARLIPAIHASKTFREKFAAGFSVNAPWGLATEYPVTGVTRYQSTYSELRTMNLSASLAYAPTKWISFGGGADALNGKAELDAVIGNGFTAGSDSQSINEGDGWAWGWHAGVLASIQKTHTKIGANFHSQINLTMDGHSKLIGPLNPAGTVSENLSASVALPWFADASLTQEFGHHFTVLATVEYIHWSSIQQLELKNVQTPFGPANTIDPLNYSDSLTYLLGVRYKLNDSVMFKLGGGYDQTPTSLPDRSLPIPDSNRWIASGGIRWYPAAAKHVFVDVGYAHLFTQTAEINKTKVAGPQTTNANGDVDGGANLFGAQLSLKV